MDIVLAYKNYLRSKQYASTTIRNYLCDLDHFLNFYKTKTTSNSYNDPIILNEYLNLINQDINSNRYLSSLKKFYQFAIDQNIFKTNPLKEIQKNNLQGPNLTEIISNYKQFLQKKHKTSVTIKNYLADIQQFINFCESQ